jgi:hypothetical protein
LSGTHCKPISCQSWEYPPDSSLPARRQIRKKALRIKRITAKGLPGYDSSIEAEIKIAGLMINLYCRGHHGGKD